MNHLLADVGLDGRRFVYWFESGAIKGKRFDPQGNLLESEFTAISPADDNSFGVTVDADAQGVNRVVIDYANGGVLSTMTSQDGITFS